MDMKAIRAGRHKAILPFIPQQTIRRSPPLRKALRCYFSELCHQAFVSLQRLP